jgi:excisionase family DNA binding protein
MIRMRQVEGLGTDVLVCSVERKCPPLATSVDDAAQSTNLGKATIYAAMANGELSYLKFGRRRLILVDDLRAWLETYRAA